MVVDVDPSGESKLYSTLLTYACFASPGKGGEGLLRDYCCQSDGHVANSYFGCHNVRKQYDWLELCVFMLQQ